MHQRRMPLAKPSLSDLALIAAYAAAATVTIGLTRIGGGVAILWLASSVLIAVLLVIPRSRWPVPLAGCALASTLVTGLFGLGWALAVPFAIANITEAYVAARLFRQYRQSHVPLGSMSWILRFIVCVGVIAPVIAGLIAASALAVAGRDFTSNLANFVTGHGLGNITFIPLFTMVVGGRFAMSLRHSSGRKQAEAVALLSLVLASTLLVFVVEGWPLLFLPLLPLILLTFRAGASWAAAAVVVVAVVGGGLTLAGSGPIQLIEGSLSTKLQFFQLYLAAMVLTVLPVAADLRHRAWLHRELRLSEGRYRLLADNLTDIVIHMNADGTIRYASPSIRQLGGYDPELLAGRHILSLVPPESLQQVKDGHLATLAARGATYSYRHLARLASGELRWFESNARVLLDEHGEQEGILSVVRDISRQVAVEERMEAAALTDPLTGLGNRRAFRAAVEQLMSDDAIRPVSIAVIDIDHFKRVNDDYGHDAGDDVLRTFAMVAQGAVRRNDLVARIGGEEFAVLLPGLDRDGAIAICERMRVQVAESLCVTSAGPVRITVSGGVAALGADGLDACLRDADSALYLAKAAGRDRMALAA
ncbi:sensor domain-containing diguanylate cyclase [Sphingomonas xanthus]|uniref:diguanylate cyclase n=1 Tax=Sphingomonas xanthus TaxID=2594473 RepID=A0A516ITE6_9SPHN|nr:sensor domain-containing diguanylate cyclase [Sphingomonas xanthus]QDP20155.1 diguanylate cyclase [Sphingomonas xanthus]